jgi:hypothetical protein
MTTYRVTLTFTEPMLGTAPQDKEIYSNYILETNANGDNTTDELETVRDEKGRTGFHKLDDGTPIIYDYMIKGFFKDVCGMLSRVGGSNSKKLKAYKKIIDGLVFVFPRRIKLNASGPITILERPLRAQTAQGERVALAASEMVPEGTTCTFTIDVLEDDVVSEELLREWLNYAKYRGFGQWRNGSYGRASYTMERC